MVLPVLFVRLNVTIFMLSQEEFYQVRATPSLQNPHNELALQPEFGLVMWTELRSKEPNKGEKISGIFL